MNLNQKFAVITGGSEGIGAAIARLFAENGANIWLVGRNEVKLQRIFDELKYNGNTVHLSAIDLTVPEERERFCSDVLKTWPHIDVLVNNAGHAYFKNFNAMTLENYDGLFDLNVKAPIFITQRLLPHLEIAEGSIINISSYFSRRMLRGIPSNLYSATKGAMESFTKALALEVAPRVRVNAIAPGTIETSLMKSNIRSMSPENQKQFEQNIVTNYPLQRIGQPEDVAHMALYLAGKSASWITGGIFSVDGGLTIT